MVISHFRHDLRTPLNHVIGYGEILIEALGDAGADPQSPGYTALNNVIARARELVQTFQNIPDESLAQEARQAVHEARLGDSLAALAPLLDPRHAADLEKMSQASRQLTQLVEGTVAETPARPKQVSSEQPPQAAGGVLVVDDDAGNRDLLRRMLERQGYSVTVAVSGPECLEMLSRRSFDLVLLDVIMPGMSGFDVLSRIRESVELRAVPVIVISALDESSAAIRCIQMGAEDYLPKPFDLVLLKARIGATLEKKRLRDQEARYAHDLEHALAELHGAKDKLVVQEKLASLGALTAGIAHELKNPLNFITNFASLSRENAIDLRRELASPTPDPAELDFLFKTLEENLERVESHGKRADRIVRGMLLHSHSQPGKREETDVNAVVEEAMSLAYHGMRAQDSSFNIRIEKNLQNPLAHIPAIPQDLSRVLVNVLNNAFYSTEEKKRVSGPEYAPRIMAATRDKGDAVEIVLEDNGNGIPPQVAQKIFDPFFTTKPAGAGTGLGLSISYDIIVRGHDGTIAVESEPGLFARFKIRLPKSTGKAPSA
ncbi:MAG: response regulator [Acidobacteriota bacterium]|nr:response regulator [Acidobacteriota bacterium]